MSDCLIRESGYAIHRVCARDGLVTLRRCRGPQASFFERPQPKEDILRERPNDRSGRTNARTNDFLRLNDAAARLTKAESKPGDPHVCTQQ